MGSGTLFIAVINDTTSISDLVPSLVSAELQVSYVTSINMLRELMRADVIGAIAVETSTHSNELIAQTAQLLDQYTNCIPLHVISYTEMLSTEIVTGATLWRWPRDKQRLIQVLQNELIVKNPSSQIPAKSLDLVTPLNTEIKGVSSAIQTVREAIQKTAAVDSNVLITGETGTGKGLVAELLHRLSPRSIHNLVHVNCAAIPDTLLESELFGHKKGAFTGADQNRLGKLRHAHKGTLFLDEIGDMPLASQAKILYAIESQSVQPVGDESTTKVDVRFISATNQHLDELIEGGRFRNDLFYRLDVVHIHLPPLNERREDIHHIAQHFIELLNRKFNRKVGYLSHAAFNALMNYNWPGNVRELHNAIEVAFVNQAQTEIDVEHLPQHFTNTHISTQLPDNEVGQLISALNSTHWNKTKAAERLNWSRMTLYRKMKKYNVG